MKPVVLLVGRLFGNVGPLADDPQALSLEVSPESQQLTAIMLEGNFG